MSRHSSRVVLDQVCQIAARNLRSSVAFIIVSGEAEKLNVRGSVGFNLGHVPGHVSIPGLSSSHHDLVYFDNLKNERWFADHPLQRRVAGATSLLAISIVPKQSQNQIYLAVINPSTVAMKKMQTTPLLSDLTTLATALFEIDRKEPTARRPAKHPPQALPLPSNGFQEAPAFPLQKEADEMAWFLIRTLVPRKALHLRNNVAYVTLRSWRKQAREIQVAAMQALKRAQSGYAERAVASELVGLADQLHSRAAYTAVVPIPGGSSNDENCFSVRLAREVANQMSLPFINCLDSQPAKGRSHPRKSSALKPYSVNQPISGHVLLVDDVATTGTHLEMAVAALREAGANPTAIAWIGPGGSRK